MLANGNKVAKPHFVLTLGTLSGHVIDLEFMESNSTLINELMIA